jgi:hypothetical protein
MSTLKVNTVQHNTSGFNNVVQFTDGAGTENGTLCRAWVNFNGTGTVAIRASFNVSSITDNGTGDYTVNFSNALPDSGYCAVLGVGRADADRVMPYYGEYSSTGGVDGPEDSGGGAKTTSALKVRIGFAQNARIDIGSCSCAIFR